MLLNLNAKICVIIVIDLGMWHRSQQMMMDLSMWGLLVLDHGMGLFYRYSSIKSFMIVVVSSILTKSAKFA